MLRGGVQRHLDRAKVSYVCVAADWISSHSLDHHGLTSFYPNLPNIIISMHITFQLNGPLPPLKTLNTLTWAFFIDMDNSIESSSVQ